VDWIHLAVTGTCEHGKELWRSIKGGKILHQVNNSRTLNEDIVPISYLGRWRKVKAYGKDSYFSVGSSNCLLC
jgi:hypothetical protein